MENTKVLHALDEFAKNKPKDIPAELEEYLRYVATSGDPVYQWSLVKCFFRQKMINVIAEFYESCPLMDVPLSPNVDPFNYEIMKSRLLERYDTFFGAPYTIQRIAELLSTPRKQYNHVDKFMRAIEKNIWVVSTREPGRREVCSETMVNGVVPQIVHSNNGKQNQDRLQRQSELFDDDDEDEEPTVEIPSLEPLLSSEEDEPNPVESADISVDDLPDDKTPADEQQLAVTVVESYSLSEKQFDDETKEEVSITKEDEGEPVTEICEDNDPSKSEDEDVTEDIDAAFIQVDEPKLAESEAIDNEEKATEAVTVVEVTEQDEEEKESEGNVEPQPEPKLEEPDDEPQEAISELELSSDCDRKRKFDETVEDDAEVLPSKRLETEEQVEPVVELPVDQVTPETTAEPTEAETIEARETQPKEEEAKVEVVTEIVEVSNAESLDVEDGTTMESTDMDEKLVMVVEEPDTAMEVDEADCGVQSPMAQEEIAEPMEQSDAVNS